MPSTDSSTAPTKTDHRSPWMGLSAFDESNQDLFFGRNREITDIFVRVREHPLTVLYGQSGLGKTSLLQAGLIPKLSVEKWHPVVIRLRFDESAPPLIKQIEEAINLIFESKTLRQEGETLWERFHRDRRDSADPRDASPVLIFDQFEEIFTLGQRSCRIDEVSEMMTQIADLVENRPPSLLRERFEKERRLSRNYDFGPVSVRVVITLREDFLSHLEQWKKLMPALMRNRMALHLLNGPQALEAVVRPGQLGGPTIVSDDVGAQIVRFVAKKEKHVPLEKIGTVPPLLSLVCERLNAARIENKASSVSTELVASQSTDILDSFYEESFVDQPPSLRNFVEERMVTESGHRASVTRSDLALELQRDGWSPEDSAKTIARLVQRRLVTSEERGGVKWLEITHDVLAPLVVKSRDERQERERADALSRQKRRLLIIVGAFSILMILAVAGALFGFKQASLAKRHSERAKFQEQIAREQEERAHQRVLEAATRAWGAASQAFDENGRPRIGLAKLAEAIRFNSSLPEEYRLSGLNSDAAMRMLHLAEPRKMPVVRPMVHVGDVLGASFNPNGSRILTASSDNTAQVWDAATGMPIGKTMRHRDVVRVAEFGPNGARVVTASLGTAQIWKTATGEPQGEPLRHEKYVLGASFNLDGSTVVTVSLDNTARIWDAETGHSLGVPMQHEDAVWSASFNLDGSRVVTSSWDNNARIWDAATGQPLAEPLLHDDDVLAASFSPDGLRIVTAGLDNTARIWDAVTGKPMGKTMTHEDDVPRASFSPDGSRIVTASLDNTARIWDAVTGAPIGNAMLHSGPVVAASFSPDGTRIVTASVDDTARIWDAGTGAPLGNPIRHRGPVLTAFFNPDGSRIVTASWDDTAQVWDAATGELARETMRHEEDVWNASFSADGLRVVTASSDTARVWDVATGEPLGEPMRHDELVLAASFSPDGSRVVTASWDDTAQIWDPATCKRLGAAMHHEDDVLAASFSPDGAQVVTACADKTAQIWDVATGERLGDSMHHGEDVVAASFSPDGSEVVTASWDGTAQIWDAATGKHLGDPMHHDDDVWSASYSSDGIYIVTASKDGTTRIWDAATGKQLGEPMHHEEEVVAASFNSDGSRIITASSDKSARIWDVSTRTTLGQPMRHQARLSSASFNSDGSRVVTACSDGTAQIWEFLEVSEVTLKPRDLEVFGGLAIDEKGFSVSIPAHEVENIRTEEPTDGSVNDPRHNLIRWRFSDPATRTLTPNSKRTVPDLIESEITWVLDHPDHENNAGIIKQIHRLSPGHPYMQFALALIEEHPVRREFLFNYGLERLAKDKDAAKSPLGDRLKKLALDQLVEIRFGKAE